MNLILAFLIFSNSQTGTLSDKDLLDLFKTRNSEAIVKQCSFPFDLSVGSALDDDNITDKAVLKKKLDQLFAKHYFDEFLKGEKAIEKDGVIFTIRHYNKKHELESESSLNFSFRKDKSGNRKLYRIMMAG